MIEPLKVGELHAESGTKIQGAVHVPNTDVLLPVTLIHGKQTGKRVLITAGIHGGEYVGIQAVSELAQLLEPEQMKGSVIIVHCCNPSSFRQITPAIVPEDGKNMNRMFPGRAEGTLSEQIAYMLAHTFQTGADFYLDLHGGDLHEDLTPFVFYPGRAEEAVTAAARQVACALDMPYMLKSQATTGAYNWAALQGIPSLLLERGSLGLWSRAEVDAYKQDVQAALAQLDVYPGKIFNRAPQEVVQPVYVEAALAGCWYPHVRAGEYVSKGQILGHIRDFFGRLLHSYEAEQDGVVLYVTVSLSIDQGSSLVAYAQISQ